MAATFETIARNARENFEQSAAHVGVTLSQSTFDRLRDRTEAALAHLRDIIEDRAVEASPATPTATFGSIMCTGSRSGHPPGDWVVVDCIEFEGRFRYADPMADIAFLAMELELEGRGDLAGAFVDEYLRAAGDEQGRVLLPFYRAYRAAVRGKVEGMKLARARYPRGRPVRGPNPRPGSLALRPVRAGGSLPEALPGAYRWTARDREVVPGSRPRRAGRF